MASGPFGLIGDALAPYALISSPVRAISTIIPDVVIEEVHTDDLAVTDHPVETGAAISDHAFKLPSRLEMRCGFSNSSAGTEGYVQEVYQSLLTLQAQREPFDVFTGKRAYRNMLLSRIALVTSEESENTLMVVAGLRQVLITQTQQTGAPASSQAMPERTGSVTDSGQVQPQDAGVPNLTSDVGSNTSFLTPDSSFGIGSSGSSAGFDTIIVDGVSMPSGLSDTVVETNPSALGGNPGFFGSYGPNAFAPNATSPF